MPGRKPNRTTVVPHEVVKTKTGQVVEARDGDRFKVDGRYGSDEAKRAAQQHFADAGRRLRSLAFGKDGNGDDVLLAYLEPDAGKKQRAPRTARSRLRKGK